MAVLVFRRFKADLNSKLNTTVCVFVASSDNTLDVFSCVSKSFDKYWPDCTFQKYVGLNTLDNLDEDSSFQGVDASPSRWRLELAEQLNALPTPITHVLLFLDDFLLLERVNNQEVSQLALHAQSANLKYLRFVQISRAVLPLLFFKLSNGFTSRWKRLVPTTMPYYSSLQVALWQRDHLVNMLKIPCDIWEFEHQSIGGVTHYAVENLRPLKYTHVVEKGRWKRNAKSLFKSCGIPFCHGSRPVLNRRQQFKLRFNGLKFMIFGYAFVRLKSAISRLRVDLSNQ